MKRNTKRHMRISTGDRIYLYSVYLFLLVFTGCILYPLLYVVSCSFSSPEALIQGRVFFLPVEPGLQGYTAVFNNNRVWRGYGNTILYTVTGTVVATAVTMIASFVLSRREFPLRKFMTAFFMVTMFIGGGTIPMYLWLKTMHMLNTIWALALPGAVSVWMVIVGKTFLQSTIPEELFEAACLDGGSYIQYFVRVVLPLSKPIIAVMALNFALGHWNSYYSALIYLKSAEKYPLQIVLRDILIQNSVDLASMVGTDINSQLHQQYLSELLKYSLIIVSSLPLLTVYPFLQKYFIKGTMIGSVKG
ncbi:MAG: carbohydrate ABC transporter permease [Lachnospiraceae bacterium]|nr:carbohydrate ABC transporter permease [Lachnospiraceae bacterium]MDE6975777.1 carbohydrate ABC transporter permease [Lachnospiraceae bacterium]